MASVNRVSGFNIASRAATAILSMAGRHVLTILSGIIVARGLGPTQFGYFMFLLAGFTTLHTLLDLSLSQAFFNSICKRAWPNRLYLIYAGWILLQLALPLLIIGVILPGSLVSKIWNGQSRELVVLALIASFSQRVLWQTVVQIYEAHRLTIRIQLMTAAIMAVHLIVVLVLQRAGLLTVPMLLITLAAEFSLTALVMTAIVHRRDGITMSAAPAREIVREMLTYAAPLLLPLFLTSLNGFAETWLLQIFGGAHQQAFFSVAQQYANIGLVFGYPAAAVFWKELAAAHARDDVEGMHRIYANGTRVLFLMPALVAGFCIPWSEPLIRLLLGAAYAPAGQVFVVTLVNSIFQCMGLVVSVLFLATGRTRLFSRLSILQVAIGLPGSLILLWGFRMGALGLAIKLAAMSIGFHLLCDWYNCRQYGWRTDNRFRVAVLAAFFIIGGSSYLAVRWAAQGTPAGVQLVLGLAAYVALCVPAALWGVRLMGYRLSFSELRAWVSSAAEVPP